MKADLAIYNHVVDAFGQCMSESLILGFNLDFSSCDNLVGFCKSSHIYDLISPSVILTNQINYAGLAVVSVISLRGSLLNVSSIGMYSSAVDYKWCTRWLLMLMLTFGCMQKHNYVVIVLCS